MHDGQLRGETFVILRRSEAPGLWAPLASIMGGAGGVPEDVLEVAEMQTIIGLVGSGLGVSLVPASVGETDRPGVTFRPLADRSPQIELALAWAKDAHSPARDAFLALAAPGESAP
jgi:DNA-binding transcriptional LysR family regulator